MVRQAREASRITATIELEPRRVSWRLGVIATGLVIAHGAARRSESTELAVLFELDQEYNVPTLFQVALLIMAACLLRVAARTAGEDPAVRRGWTILSFGFFIMAADEACLFHERLMEPVKRLLPDLSHGFFYFAWVIPALLALAIGAPFAWLFLRRLPARARSRIALAAGLYLGGAVLVEMLGGRHLERYGRDGGYALLATLEEVLEMAGVIAFIGALLGLLARAHGSVLLRFVTARNQEKKR